MNEIKIATGHYINIFDWNGMDIYVIINEANDVDDDKILCATTYLENTLRNRELTDVPWGNIKTVLGGTFPYGTHIVFGR